MAPLDFFSESYHESWRDQDPLRALETTVRGSHARAHALAIASALPAAQHERLHEHARSCAAGEIVRHLASGWRLPMAQWPSPWLATNSCDIAVAIRRA
jgi:hypothetical protein